MTKEISQELVNRLSVALTEATEKMADTLRQEVANLPIDSDKARYPHLYEKKAVH
jgi:hypothetical protein